MNDELKKVLDERLVRGQIGPDEYVRILQALQTNENRNEHYPETSQRLTQPGRNKAKINWTPALMFYAFISILSLITDMRYESSRQEIPALFLALVVSALIASMVSFSLLHYKLWLTIPPSLRATSPGRALGFLFIPFFNIYWAFITWPKLAEGITEAQGKSDANIQWIATWYAIFFSGNYLLVFLPSGFESFSMLYTIVDFVLFVILYGALCPIANSIISKLDSE